MVAVPERKQQFRDLCYQCFRPVPFCLCADARPVNNRTGVLILQHARERFHPFGSVRLLERALQRFSLRVAFRQGMHDKRVYCPMPVPPGCALLYPSPGARQLATCADAPRPEHLLLLDGTWSQAHRLYMDNPWLRALPHVTLEPERPSLYRVRREPRPQCLSTLEAAVQALQILEPDTPGLDHLLQVFVRMNEEQLRKRDSTPATPRRKRNVARPRRAVPAVLRQPANDLVIVYGESAQLRTRADPRALHPLQWVAMRKSTDELFQRFIAPQRSTPTVAHLGCLGLDGDLLLDAVPLEEAAAAFGRFLKQTDVLAAWNASTLRMLATLAQHERPAIELKQAYANLYKHRVGSLDEVLAREAIPVPPLDLPGRAARRLANAVAIAAWLGERADAAHDRSLG